MYNRSDNSFHSICFIAHYIESLPSKLVLLVLFKNTHHHFHESSMFNTGSHATALALASVAYFALKKSMSAIPTHVSTMGNALTSCWWVNIGKCTDKLMVNRRKTNRLIKIHTTRLLEQVTWDWWLLDSLIMANETTSRRWVLMRSINNGKFSILIWFRNWCASSHLKLSKE